MRPCQVKLRSDDPTTCPERAVRTGNSLKLMRPVETLLVRVRRSWRLTTRQPRNTRSGSVRVFRNLTAALVSRVDRALTPP